MNWCAVIKGVGIAIVIVGCIIYVAWYVTTKNSAPNKRLFVSIACMLVGFALVAIPIAFNTEGCSKCGRKIENDYIFCPRCGESLSNASVCSGCGKELGNEDIFCPQCGSPVDN